MNKRFLFFLIFAKIVKLFGFKVLCISSFASKKTQLFDWISRIYSNYFKISHLKWYHYQFRSDDVFLLYSGFLCLLYIHPDSEGFPFPAYLSPHIKFSVILIISYFSVHCTWPRLQQVSCLSSYPCNQRSERERPRYIHSS